MKKVTIIKGTAVGKSEGSLNFIKKDNWFEIMQVKDTLESLIGINNLYPNLKNDEIIFSLKERLRRLESK